MTATEINTTVTIVSIVLTLVSWCITIWKWCMAKIYQKKLNSSQNENERLLNLIESFEILPDISLFHEIYLRCSQRTKLTGWNKGAKGNDIIDDVDRILRDINKHLPKISSERKFSIVSATNNALSYMNEFVAGTPETSMEMVKRLDKIDKLLQAEAVLIRKQRLNIN